MQSEALVPKTKTWDYRRLLSDSAALGPFLTLVVLFVLFSAFIPHFLSWRSVSGIVNAATPIGIVTIGVTLLMICGEFDLSVGSLVALGGYAFAALLMAGVPAPLAVLAALVLPTLFGLVNGLLLVWTGIPSFIVTLGTRSVYRGIVWLLSGGTLIQMLERPAVLTFFNGRFDLLNDLLPKGANFRTSLIWLTLMVLLFQYLLTRTTFGNHIFAVGGNVQAAASQGVNVRRVKVLSFCLSGLLAGLTGILLFSQFRTVRVTTGAGMELSAIAAAVVGGTALSGGVGSIWGALVGVLLISMLRTGVILMDLPFIPADNFEAVVGATIVGAAILNNWIQRRRS